eukprot:CAMPEP_0194237336 /NCGR_PEP_ID=MMETSP0158-20130606/4375_1 /TAXON_ID=33649 /ORGANISM="Thalassionema nitzschioides, Strain L26-B" /LENGTH=232 /DNA_ID=CAMNT_0038971337 /DNA_START=28 /DNA_END=726 /DNA_ORIENTATION=+
MKVYRFPSQLVGGIVTFIMAIVINHHQVIADSVGFRGLKKSGKKSSKSRKKSSKQMINEVLDDWEDLWSVQIIASDQEEFAALTIDKANAVLELVSDDVLFRDTPFALSNDPLFDGTDKRISDIQTSEGNFEGKDALRKFLYYTFSFNPIFQMKLFRRVIVTDGIPTATTLWFLSGIAYKNSTPIPSNYTVTSIIEFDPSTFEITSVVDNWDASQWCPPSNSDVGICSTGLS